jgi:hypothetical protein
MYFCLIVYDQAFFNCAPIQGFINLGGQVAQATKFCTLCWPHRRPNSIDEPRPLKLPRARVWAPMLQQW